MKPEEIAALQRNELAAHNAGLVSVIEAEAKKPLEEKISEMTKKDEEQTKKVEEHDSLLGEIRKMFNLDDKADPVEALGKVAKQLQKAGATVREALVEKAIARKFSDDGTRKLVRRLLTAEMQGVELSGDEKKDEEKVSEMVNDFINSDEELKGMVSEMEGTTDPPQTGKDSKTGDPTRGWKPGYKSTRVRVRSAS